MGVRRFRGQKVGKNTHTVIPIARCGSVDRVFRFITSYDSDRLPCSSGFLSRDRRVAMSAIVYIGRRVLEDANGAEVQNERDGDKPLRQRSQAYRSSDLYSAAPSSNLAVVRSIPSQHA